MTVEDLKNFFMAVDGSFEYFKDCYLSYILLKIIIQNRQSRKTGHKTITVLQMNEKFVLRENLASQGLAQEVNLYLVICFWKGEGGVKMC